MLLRNLSEALNFILRATVTLAALGAATPCLAYNAGSFFIDPHVAVGANTAQGTHFIGGLDVGYAVSEQLAAGVHGYYSAGERPKDDREMGGGAFVGYVQPFASFLLGLARQELNYVDLYRPLTANGVNAGHAHEMGVASVTSAGFHLFLGHLGFGFGYRLVVAPANRDLADGRSGFFLGFSIGI